MKRITLLSLLVFISLLAFSQQLDYYKNKNIEGLSAGNLKTALHKLISNHTDVGYDGLFEVYKTSDNKGNGMIWDMYSTCDFTFADHGSSYTNVCDIYNREHTIPQSWFGKASPMKSDAHQVIPTDGKVNGLRSNYPHGETDAASIGGKALGKIGKGTTASGYTEDVYEPDDEYKGDIARMYFYFVTCYEDKLSDFSGAVLEKNKYPGLSTWFYKLMIKWHINDPVSQKEIDRNNAIYVHQKNRNPFIDYPALAEFIWGDRTKQKFSFSAVPTPPAGGGNGGGEIPNPDPNPNPQPGVGDLSDYVIFVTDRTVTIQGLNKESVTIQDGIGQTVFHVDAVQCTIQVVTLPKAGLYNLSIGDKGTQTIEIK